MENYSILNPFKVEANNTFCLWTGIGIFIENACINTTISAVTHQQLVPISHCLGYIFEAFYF
jgi:hypothetical protein